jgi:alpha-mannosidase
VEGELYLELHRGTLTTQGWIKKANRRAEESLRRAELLLAGAPGRMGEMARARDALEEAWKLVLLNQFHDIVPGSSVREVYDDSLADYARVEEEAGALLAAAMARLSAPLGPEPGPGLAVFHNSQIPGEARVPWSGQAAPSSFQCGAERTAVQRVEDEDGTALVFATPEAALGSVAVGRFSDAPPPQAPRLKSSPRRIENDEWVVRFDGQGQITSVASLDDDPIEFIAPGELANVFQVFDDKPLFWDAWDVDAYALETMRPLLRSESFELVERGPVRVAVETVKRFGDSTIRQRVSLGPTPGIRFDTWVDWHESERMLKVAFPLGVNTASATCEVQFGHVERPTHRNTSWDVARFEVCAQKWVDMSEGGHGVALLNDGKYGHDFLGSTMRLTLLRSPKAPDPQCDMGRHRFTYVLLPHYGRLQHSDVVAASYALNAPVRTAPVDCQGGGPSALPRLVWTSDRSLVVESVKRSEDGRALIVRLYECHNTRGTATVACAVPVSRAFRADLRERWGDELEVVDGSIRLSFRPFEIVTLALVP